MADFSIALHSTASNVSRIGRTGVGGFEGSGRGFVLVCVFLGQSLGPGFRALCLRRSFGAVA